MSDNKQVTAQSQSTPQTSHVPTPSQDDWEIEEIVAAYDRVSQRGGTKQGGSTGCH